MIFSIHCLTLQRLQQLDVRSVLKEFTLDTPGRIDVNRTGGTEK